MKNTIKKTFAALLVTLFAFAVLTVPSFATDGKDTVDQTFFGEIFAEVKEHSAEVFSALTLVGSCVLAFSYKNGLLPTLKKSVGGIGNVISEIKDNTDKAARASETIESSTKEGVLALTNAISSLGDALYEVKDRITALERDEDERESFELLIGEQVSLLYDIFMSSSMPEYRKEAVCKRLERMKETIAAKDGDGGEGQSEN